MRAAKGVVFEISRPSEIVRLPVVPGGATASHVTASVSYPAFLDIEHGTHALAGVTAYMPGDLSFGAGRDAQPAHAWLVSSSFFSVLGGLPAAGHMFAAHDGMPVRGGACTASSRSTPSSAPKNSPFASRSVRARVTFCKPSADPASGRCCRGSR